MNSTFKRFICTILLAAFLFAPLVNIEKARAVAPVVAAGGAIVLGIIGSFAYDGIKWASGKFMGWAWKEEPAVVGYQSTQACRIHTGVASTQVMRSKFTIAGRTYYGGNTWLRCTLNGMTVR